jgi:hypothetical protein
MDRMDAIAWVLSVCIHLRLSQAKTLSELVAATLGVGRLSLANIGRGVGGAALVKHKIKRVWRFIRNRRVEPSDVMKVVVSRLLRNRFQSRKPLVVSFDWTDIRKLHTLMAAAVIKGRAVPLCWGCYADHTLGKSQNALEEALLLVLRQMIPPTVKVILLADRGFGRTELARFCQRYGFHYVIRIKTKVWIKTEGFAGNLKDYPVAKGMCRRLQAVEYRKTKSIVQNLVIRWKKGLPPKHDEPWYLMTDLQGRALDVSNLYARRFDIEEFFRDAKSGQFGWALEKTRVRQADRLERLLLVLVLAYLLLIGLGLHAKAHYPSGRWCSNNRPNECSAFTIGRVMLTHLHLQIDTLLDCLCRAVERIGANWG